MFYVLPKVKASALATILAGILVGACAAKKNQVAEPSPPPATPPSRAAERQSEEMRALRDQVGRLELELDSVGSQRAELERSLETRKLEVARLEEANSMLELELASALDELLRSQASLRNVQSRAFAISRIAEVRVELESTRTKWRGAKQERLDRADDFLLRADAELDKGNAGGAAYLADRAGELVRQVRTAPNQRD